MSREIDDIKDAAGGYRRWALEARKKYTDLRLRQDPEIRGLYIRSADRVARELRGLVLKTPSSYLRKRQLVGMEEALRAEAERIRGGLEKALGEYIEQAVDAGGGYSQAITMDLLKKAGIGASGLRTMLASVNRQAVEACWARTKKGLYLSDHIWQQGENYRNTVRDIIQEAVATGQDAVKTARMLQQYVRKGKQTIARDYPKMMERMGSRIPGDICYEALRLARTEMTAAFGEGTVAAAQASPSYIGMKWVLSASHPIRDICDYNASSDDDGLGEGVYAPGNEPPFPAHPNCICHIVPCHEQPEKFVERLKGWKENPSSEPNIEKWYQDVYKAGNKQDTVEKPAFLRIGKHERKYNDTADRKQIKDELALVPAKHRELLKKMGVTIETGHSISGYNRTKRIIRTGKNPVAGEVVHEVGHAIESTMDLYKQSHFLKVLFLGIPVKKITENHLVIDLDHELPFVRLEYPGVTKFVSPYQALVYPADADGVEMFVVVKDKRIFNPKVLGEYFAEGYRVFAVDPDRLRAKDFALYDFISKLVK